MSKMLSNVKVVEMGTFITGPAAGMFLADMGADVIKVERPESGDPFRAFKGELYSPHFQTYNRNKRSIELDTRDSSDLAKFDALIKEADVFIENFRPGVADKLNVDFARLKALNPKLIYCSISGFGPKCPRSPHRHSWKILSSSRSSVRLHRPPGLHSAPASAPARIRIAAACT